MSDQSPKRLAGTLQLFIEIVRMRRGPHDLPFDPSLLRATVLAYGLLQLAVGLLLPGEKVPAVAMVLVDIVLTLVTLRWLLRLAGKPERFVQTATAIFGCHFVLAPVLLLVAWLFLRYGGADGDWQAPVLILTFAVGVWVLMIAARILRSATEWPMVACVAAILALEMLTRLVLVLLFPQLLTTPTQT